jgi:hypothetical protein
MRQRSRIAIMAQQLVMNKATGIPEMGMEPPEYLVSPPRGMETKTPETCHPRQRKYRSNVPHIVQPCQAATKGV